MWTFSTSISHFILNQLPQKDMYLPCTTVPSFFHLTHQMELEPEERSRLPVQSMEEGRLSGQIINETTHTYCCHLHLVYVYNLWLTFRPVLPTGFLEIPCPFKDFWPPIPFLQEGRPFLQKTWISSLKKYNLSSEPLHRFNTLLCIRNEKVFQLLGKSSNC